MSTHAFPSAHFATFPPELAERCIKAGTSERGACGACGKPWVRVTERQFTADPRCSSPEKAADRPKPLDASNGWNGMPRGTTSATTAGWSPGCQCDSIPQDRMPNERQELRGRDSPQGVDRRVGAAGGAAAPAQPVPCTILDPFAGAGTTLLVADRLQRDAIGIELNVAYTELAMERCRADAPLFTAFPPAEPPEDERMADLFTDMAAD